MCDDIIFQVVTACRRSSCFRITEIIILNDLFGNRSLLTDICEIYNNMNTIKYFIIFYFIRYKIS